MSRAKLAAAASRTTDKNARRVLRALEEAKQRRVNANDPIMEQLRQCPEAFKVGEILGKAFDSLTLKAEANSETDICRHRAWSFRRSCDRPATGSHVPQAQGNSIAILHEVG